MLKPLRRSIRHTYADLQSRFVRDWIFLVSFVARFERLQEDFATVCKRIGQKAELPHLKASRHAHYSHYYDADTRAIVARNFARDIECLGYAFERPNRPTAGTSA